jgi:hypothetical protein
LRGFDHADERQRARGVTCKRRLDHPSRARDDLVMQRKIPTASS